MADSIGGATVTAQVSVLGGADAGTELEFVGGFGGHDLLEGLEGTAGLVELLVELSGDVVVAGAFVALLSHLGGGFEVGDGLLEPVLLQVVVGLYGDGLAAYGGEGAAVIAQVFQDDLGPVEVVALDERPGQPEADLLVGGAVLEDVVAGLAAVFPAAGVLGGPVAEDGDHAHGALLGFGK